MGTRSTKEDIRRVASFSSFVQSNSDESERRRYERQRDSDLASCFRAPSLRRRERAFNVPIGVAAATRASYEISRSSIHSRFVFFTSPELSETRNATTRLDSTRLDSSRLVSSRLGATRFVAPRFRDVETSELRVAIYSMSMSISKFGNVKMREVVASISPKNFCVRADLSLSLSLSLSRSSRSLVLSEFMT